MKHEGEGYCLYCDLKLTSTNRNAYCPGKGYYTKEYPRGLKSKSAWRKLGLEVRVGQAAAGYVYAPGLPSNRQWYAVYSMMQCTAILKGKSK